LSVKVVVAVVVVDKPNERVVDVMGAKLNAFTNALTA
jgi:hypothetical protein